MRRRSVHLFMVVAFLPSLYRRSMASFSAGTRYAVQLLAPPEGPILGVAASGEKASARCGYEVLQEPAGGSFDGLQVCVWVDSMAEGTAASSRSGPFCFYGPQQELPIDGLEVGSHRVSAAVVAPSQQGPQQLSGVATAQVDVVLRRDFVPSYEWQQVYPWQSIPPGLEVQLPLDGVGQKRARVPPAWRLQLYIPGGERGAGAGSKKHDGGFFVRTDLSARSTVLDLRREIARQPRFGLPVERLRLSLGDRVLGDEETAEGLNLFNRQKELVPLVDRSP